MTKKKKEKRKKGSYRSFASPFIRWSLRFLWDGRKRGGDGRVEPSLRRGENWPSCFFRVSRTRLQVVVVVLREKLLRLVKLCSLRTGTYKYFSYLYRFLRVFRFPVKFSLRESVVEESIALLFRRYAWQAKRGKKNNKERDKLWRGKLFSLG